MYLAASVYLFEAPDRLPRPSCYTLYEYIRYPCTYSHREGGGGG